MLKHAMRTDVKTASVFLALLMLAACQPQRELKASFSTVDHATWAAKGNASVSGEGFIRRPNGFLARCSGNKVYLLPASPYFQEWVAIRRSGAVVANSSELTKIHRQAQRETQCDQRGRFAFAELPTGRWFVFTNMSYASANDPYSENALYIADVETRPDHVAEVVLSNPNRI